MSLLHRASFTVSAALLEQLPEPTTAEVAFVGRSNSGKSSAINVLTNQRRLAEWIAPTGIPVLALLTKADKFPYGQRLKVVAAVKKELATIGALNAIPFSATHRIGIEDATAHIENWISPTIVP